MTHSMTAFARQTHSAPWGETAWEVRSVNHRYLEISLRLPEECRKLEPRIREQVSAQLNRGKIDVTLRISWNPGDAQPALNKTLARHIASLSHEVQPLLGDTHPADPIALLRWPGVVAEPERDMAPVYEAVMAALDQALDDLVETRSREGARLQTLITDRCQLLSEQVANVRTHRPDMLKRLRERLQTRLAELPLDADPGRLEQELVIQAQRLDVAEELDRMDTHLAEIESVLSRTEPIGRRLDFLMQELNREANTLASKSNDSDTTRSSVDIKVLIEQMREQVQNIE